jgi:uncharacterized protein (DUF305 family)
MPHRSRVLVAASCLVALGACTGDGGGDRDDAGKAPVVQLGGPGETNRPLTEGEVEDLEGPPAHTAGDVAFAQNMIPHHEQALVMTAMVGDRTDSADLPRLAERMDVSQRAEITQLEEWLEARDEELPEAHEHHAGHDAVMPGMLSEQELATLRSARGAAFDRLFLQFMIRHHEGALIMVGDLLAGDGGQEPAIFQLAQHIDADQRVEIARMRAMLARLGSGGR